MLLTTNIAVCYFRSAAGTAAVRRARPAAVATPLATAAPSASIKTGRGTTSSAAQDFRLSPNLCRPSLQAEQQQQQQQGRLLWVWLGPRPQTALRPSPAPVERRQQSLLDPPLRPPRPQPPKPTDTRQPRTWCEQTRLSWSLLGKNSRREPYSG